MPRVLDQLIMLVIFQGLKDTDFFFNGRDEAQKVTNH